MISIHFQQSTNLQQPPPFFPNLSRISHSTVRLRQCQCHLDRFLESTILLTVQKSPNRAWVSDTKATSNTWEKKPLVPPSYKKNMGGETETEHLCVSQQKCVFFPEKETHLNRKGCNKKNPTFNFCPKNKQFGLNKCVGS